MAFSFLAFADFHYKKKMYASTVRDLQCILQRAANSKVDMILHAGDFCNHYPGSPEVTKLLMQNPYGLPVFGCYGNHELETAGTAMSFVSPRITNRSVVWGTEDGSIGDGGIGHYYVDHGEYRIISLDTNYSLTPDGRWERNGTGSHCPAAGNTLGDSLGPDQLLWLDSVLTDAAQKGLRCILLSHASFDSRPDGSPDATAVRALLAKANATRQGTVLMAVNGHYHTDNCKVEEGVLYFDVNSVRNGWWAEEPHGKYREDAPTFPFISYDEEGDPIGEAEELPLLSLRQGKRTLFSVDPLSAVVTVDGDTVTIAGTRSRWVEDLAPDTDRTDVVPFIRDRVVQLS